MSNNLYPNIGSYIRELRTSESLPLRKLAAKLDIDQSILSKIERGIRKPKRQMLTKIAKIFGLNEKELLIQFYSDELVTKLYKDDFAFDVLKVAEQKIKYSLKNKK